MRQRVGQRRPRHVRAQDLRRDLLHDLVGQAQRLGIERRVALGIAAERVELGGQVAVRAVRLDQRGRRLHGLQELLAGGGLGRGGGRLGRRLARGDDPRLRRRGRGAERRAEVAEDRLVELVLALQVLLDDLQELAGLGALDDAMVVRRRHRHHLLGADLRADRAEAGRVADRAGGDDRALAVHQARDRGDGADAARVGERHVGALEVVRGQRVVARAGDQVVERGEELGEGEAPGVADHRHHQRAPAVLALHVDGDAEVHGAGVDHVRLAVDLAEGARHHRHLLGRRAGDRVRDEVREGDLLARPP